MIAFNKVVSHFAVSISNKIMLKSKQNVAVFCVYLLVKGVGILSRVHKSLNLRLVNMSQFKCPSSIIISGPSQCGKTTFTRQILQHADCLFERPIRKIVYCYGQWQDCFKELVKEVTFMEGIPDDIPAVFPPPHRPGLLVLDDLMRNCSDDERILDLFTKVSHHCDVTCIYLTQNLFPQESFPEAFLLMLITSLLLTILEILWG